MIITEQPKLDERIETLLQDRGYTIVRKVGEGNTRDVFEVEYRNGSLVKRRIAKIPKKEIDQSSVTTRINLSKGDLDEREVIALNKARHQNIIEIYDAFKLGDRTVTIEEYYDAISLEDLVKMTGPIKDPKIFKKIFSQVIEGLKYLHHNERLLHRDIKPSNILVGKDDNFVKISDLQNAGKLDEITENMLPTRGGTAYTHPKILNALMTGQEISCSLESEFYTLGATMYYALTGKQLFDRKLLSDKLGRIITINGEGVNVLLTEDGTPVEKIDLEQHERMLKKKLKEVPKKYRQLLHNCLSLEKKYPYHSTFWTYAEFSRDFEDATRVELINWNKIKNHAWMGTFGAALLAGILAGSKFMEIQDRHAKLVEPTIFQMLNDYNFDDGSLGFLIDDINQKGLETLIPHFEEIKQNIRTYEDKYSKFIKNKRTPIEVACDIHRMSRRLSYSLIRSVLMESEENIKEEYGEYRYELSLVPKAYVNKVYQSLHPRIHDPIDDHQKIGFGIRYLKSCIGNNNSVANVFASYFASPDEIFGARYSSRSPNYLPTKQLIDGKQIDGYGQFLSPTKRRLIERALALYHITDAEGNLHLEILDANNRPIKGLDAK